MCNSASRSLWSSSHTWTCKQSSWPWREMKVSRAWSLHGRDSDGNSNVLASDSWCMRSAVGLRNRRESEQGRWEGQSCTLLPWDAPRPTMPLGCPVTSARVCTVINKCESYTPSLLQNIGLSELYRSRNILKKLLRHASWFSEQLKLSDNVWGPRVSIFSMLFQWPQPGLYHIWLLQVNTAMSCSAKSAVTSALHFHANSQQ